MRAGPTDPAVSAALSAPTVAAATVRAGAADASSAVAAADTPRLTNLDKHLHDYPGQAFQETATAARLVTEASAAGLTVTTGVGGYGVVAVMVNGAGAVLLKRARSGADTREDRQGRVTRLQPACPSTSLGMSGAG